MYQVDKRSKLFKYINAVIDIRLSGLNRVNVLSKDEIYFMRYMDFADYRTQAIGFKANDHLMYFYGNKIQDHHSTTYKALVSYFNDKGFKVFDERILSLCYISLVLFEYSIDVSFFLGYLEGVDHFDVRDFETAVCMSA